MSTRQIKFYNRIGFKLSAWITVVIFSAVSTFSIWTAQQSLQRETENYETLIRGAASAYAASVTDAVNDRQRTATLSALRGIRDLPNVVQADIILPDGQVFVELGSGAWLIDEQAMDQSIWRKDHVRIELPIVKSGSEIAQLGMLADITPLRSDILRHLFMTLVTSLIISVLGILLAQVFVSRLTAPIRKLTTAMTSFRTGDQDDAIELKKRKDETGLLTQSFEDMIMRIAERDRQINHHVETLEDTVEERTRDYRLAKDEAEAANAAKSDFLATMSHEIRTPMNGMMVMAEMLGAADLSPRHRRYAEIIHRSGHSLLTIINDILDLSKIEAGQLDLEQIPVCPEILVADVASLFWERARGKELALATYVSPRVPKEILADPTRINQVISNLVNNALKFTDKGGVLIRLDARAVGGDKAELVLEVIDTGIGIPKDKIETIFESFSQADQSTTRRFGGTGLGLTVCRRLVDAMSGEISATSTPGAGSTFRVEVPVQIEHAAPSIEAWPFKVGIRLQDGIERVALEQTLTDFGCILSDDRPEFWISSSEACRSVDGPCVLLTDIGDTQADTLLNEGHAVDTVSNPYTRQDISDLLSRARKGAWRGTAAIQANGASAPLPSFEGLRILAAEDNAVNREVLREALTTLKVSAVFVENGRDAVDRFEQDQFDLVLMDGSMPEMDGFEATRQIRSFEQAAQKQPTPIFALTAQVAGTSQSAWTQAGADGHILKPFTLEKLANVMRDLTAASEDPVDDAVLDQDEGAEDMLDLSTVESLEKLGPGDGSVRDRVWAMFQEKAPNMLTELCQALHSGLSSDVASRAHAFKSMALSSGFAALAKDLQSLELKATSDQLEPEVAPQIEELTAILDRTHSAIEQYRAQAA